MKLVTSWQTKNRGKVSSATNSIANQVDRMAHMAEESSAAAGLSAEAAKQLDQLAADMQRIVSRYKL